MVVPVRSSNMATSGINNDITRVQFPGPTFLAEIGILLRHGESTVFLAKPKFHGLPMSQIDTNRSLWNPHFSALENHVSVAQIHIFKGKLHPVDPLGVNLDEDVLRRRPGAVEKSHELTLQYLGLVTYQIKVYPLTFSGLVYTFVTKWSKCLVLRNN